jgi:hypothetical protein
MTPWQRVWRTAAPLISTPALLALRKALEEDDSRLIQGATTSPTAIMVDRRKPCEGACLLGFVGMAEGMKSALEVEDHFARMCFRIDEAMGEPAGVRYLLNWYDETPRAEAFCLLLAEVALEIDGRAA